MGFVIGTASGLCSASAAAIPRYLDERISAAAAVSNSGGVKVEAFLPIPYDPLPHTMIHNLPVSHPCAPLLAA